MTVGGASDLCSSGTTVLLTCSSVTGSVASGNLPLVFETGKF